tara:strand:- start:1154 stop:1474 length:321 start_codon:yes stop_codon:yes gene_type:complete
MVKKSKLIWTTITRMSQPQKDSSPNKTDLLKSILNIGNQVQEDNKIYKNEKKTNLDMTKNEKTELLKKVLRIRTEFSENEIKTQMKPPILRRPSRDWNQDNNEDDP